MTGRICGVGAYVPDTIIDNNDLSKIVDTNDEWIRERTGIQRRHVINGENTVTMASRASEEALKNADMKAEEIDLILVSTSSSNVILPCAACEVQRMIGAVNAVCFDLNAACSGFLFAFNTAQSYIAAGLCKTALVIGSESFSTLLDWEDRSTCILFGDGAGAAVLKAEKDSPFAAVMHSNGSKGNVLTLESRHQKDWENAVKDGRTYLRMDGQEVYKFAVKQVPSCIKELLVKIKKEAAEIDYFVLHQANKRIVASVAKRLSVDLEKFPTNLEEYGNTSSASIPILLAQLEQEGKLTRGKKMIMIGFGAGLSWGAAYFEW